MIKVGEEMVRFGILVNGVDTHKITNIHGQSSHSIEEKLIGLFKTAQKISCDFPEKVREDITSGRFLQRITRYQR
jgi:hypothetical protein